jgi:hypothetical protein
MAGPELHKEWENRVGKAIKATIEAARNEHCAAARGDA